MKNKVSKEDSRLNNLDKSAESIGMGGNLIPNITEEKYRKRMEKRKEMRLQLHFHLFPSKKSYSRHAAPVSRVIKTFTQPL